jgi:UDP-3-O-[3-hydroxymyristoyl] glucosamine N-acyltransferase
MASMTLGDVAVLVGGQLTGDPGIPITGASVIRDASSGDLTLADCPPLVKKLEGCQAVAAIVPPGLAPKGLAFVAVDDVHAAFAKVVEWFRPRYHPRDVGLSPGAHISPSARIAPDAVVHAGVTIGEDVEIGAGTAIYPGVCVLPRCRIGRDVTLFPNVVLYESTVVGNRVVIHANAVIGAYGFGYETVNGRHKRSAQLGYVEIGDDVEIGACTTVDRGTYGPTRIGEGTKIDNQVMIAHNCRIGKHNLICSQVGIAGSCTTGDYVIMAGQVGLRDHIDVGNHAILGAKSGVMKDVPPDSHFVGIPATPEREQLLKQVAWSKLPEMRQQFKALQKQVADLAAALAAQAHQEVA